jgi:hypothetical protein
MTARVEILAAIMEMAAITAIATVMTMAFRIAGTGNRTILTDTKL